MNEHAKSGVLGTAAMKAGMHRETGTKYLAAGHGPQPEKRRGRRRADPLTTLWPAAERLLADAPEVEAKALFEHLLARSAATDALPAQKALRTFRHQPERPAERWPAERGQGQPNGGQPNGVRLLFTSAASRGSLEPSHSRQKNRRVAR